MEVLSTVCVASREAKPGVIPELDLSVIISLPIDCVVSKVEGEKGKRSVGRLYSFHDNLKRKSEAGT